MVHSPPPFPPVDVHERDHQLIVIMEIAGANREQIELSAVGNRLVIKGRTICPLSQTTIIQKERREGGFHREIDLPRNIEDADYKATFRNGLLFIVFTFQE
ncbi:Hsp20/alpha crystallin family protein [Priestia abyssalis]|uniref:Hsp20/alpha crystallin family protein n=1 Tax=Priestia abyssalis TaxID=1221450 RepID=UPI00099548A6|nr:Hsp20/alpha crystallin family protein [Priestia abyssalis]